jgi:hypothetical protein
MAINTGTEWDIGCFGKLWHSKTIGFPILDDFEVLNLKKASQTYDQVRLWGLSKKKRDIPNFWQQFNAYIIIS